MDKYGWKKKGRCFGLGFKAKSLIASSSHPTRFPANSRDGDGLRSLIHALNRSLYRKELEKHEIRQELT